jgi:hypothetical protein
MEANLLNGFHRVNYSTLTLRSETCRCTSRKSCQKSGNFLFYYVSILVTLGFLFACAIFTQGMSGKLVNGLELLLH